MRSDVEAPTVVEAPGPVIPASCYLQPVEPQPVEQPSLEPLPPPTASTYLAIRTRNAERAGLYYRSDSEALREAYDVNAAAQRACATGLGLLG